MLKNYLDQPTNDIRYYQWAKLFVPTFQLSRWLDAYVYLFAGIGKRTSFRLEQITSPRTDSASSGGGRDAPPINRTLGIGACFVVRELCRLKVVNSKPAHNTVTFQANASETSWSATSQAVNSLRTVMRRLRKPKSSTISSASR